MDHSTTAILDALAEHHADRRYGFSPPGHRQGRGADERTLAGLSREPFRDDVLTSSGLDDRRSSGGYLKTAEDLMADAVGAESTFFSTCGSSLSVKAAMMAVSRNVMADFS
jgi:arginine decarboxylase